MVWKNALFVCMPKNKVRSFYEEKKVVCNFIHYICMSYDDKNKQLYP